MHLACTDTRVGTVDLCSLKSITTRAVAVAQAIAQSKQSPQIA